MLLTQRIVSKWHTPFNVLNCIAMLFQFFSELAFHIYELVTLRTCA